MGVVTGTLVALAFLSLVVHPVVRRFGPPVFLALGGVLFVVFAILAVHAVPVVTRGAVLVEQLDWIPQLGMTIGFRYDGVAVLFALLTAGAGALVLLYCAYYFEAGEAGLARFAAVFMGFSTSMLGLVLADDVYLLFIFWEATTVFSFLLIGHVTRLRTANAAALQALIVTTFGGLAMLVGLVILAVGAGTSSLAAIVADPPSGPAAVCAVFLIMVGALSKSAIFPFHFWLPGAMSAPTPVSAYLHAAAMVKAGVYLIARVLPGFIDVWGLREMLVVLGAITMLNGGIRALRQYDIKLLVAHGTVSQLGLLVMVIGLGEPRALFAGMCLLLAHAVAKAPLFLSVGVIDLATGTRDLRELSGLGRNLPLLAALSIAAALSMAGVPPFLGFVAKEVGLTELLALAPDSPLSLFALIVLTIGSVLTVAYMGRFLWGAFMRKRGVADTPIENPPPRGIYIPPALFVLLALGTGFAPHLLEPVLRSGFPSAAAPLALWHGFTLPLLLTLGILVLGFALLRWRAGARRQMPAVPERFSASHAYWVVTQLVDTVAVRLTTLTQRGSLPFYLAVILIVTVAVFGGAALGAGGVPEDLRFMSNPTEVPIAAVMIVAALFALRARTRFQALILVGVTGYGMAALFATHGAPDLALTQVLVETVTLIAFVLVIRRLPQHIGVRAKRKIRWGRAALGAAIGVSLGLATLISLGARVADPISLELPTLAEIGGHGSNVVNVILVDIRGWDTLGELSVVLAAATGVASLVFLNTRADLRPKLSRRAARDQARENLLRVADPNDPASRVPWILAGRTLEPSRRSIMLEVVVRLVFHGLIILSLYLLLTGHNSPGGGFAGGLVAGLALVARYLAGGRHELGATVPLDAGRILGTGLALAVTMAIAPMLFGQSALASSWVDLDLGIFGTLPVVTSALFDIGVYLVVFGLILDVLRSLGAEIDEHEAQDTAAFVEEGGRI